MNNVFRVEKIIFKGIKKIDKQYTIVTIKKYFILDFYSITFYIPSTARRWISYIHLSDFLNFDYQFMDKIFPFKLYETIEEIRNKHKDFISFT